MADYPSPAEIVRLIEERGRDGRDRLFGTEHPDRIARLSEALRVAASAHVRTVLCNLLASLADPAALPQLLDRLSDPDPGVVAAAADAVGNCAYEQKISEDLQHRLGTTLMNLARDTSQPLQVRTGAIYGLGLMRHHPALSVVLNALESDQPRERLASAEALAHIGVREAIPALRLRLYREEDERVKRYLAAALEELSDK